MAGVALVTSASAVSAAAMASSTLSVLPSSLIARNRRLAEGGPRQCRGALIGGRATTQMEGPHCARKAVTAPMSRAASAWPAVAVICAAAAKEMRKTNWSPIAACRRNPCAISVAARGRSPAAAVRSPSSLYAIAAAQAPPSSRSRTGMAAVSNLSAATGSPSRPMTRPRWASTETAAISWPAATYRSRAAVRRTAAAARSPRASARKPSRNQQMAAPIASPADSLSAKPSAASVSARSRSPANQWRVPSAIAARPRMAGGSSTPATRRRSNQAIPSPICPRSIQ